MERGGSGEEAGGGRWTQSRQGRKGSAFVEVSVERPLLRGVGVQGRRAVWSCLILQRPGDARPCGSTYLKLGRPRPRTSPEPPPPSSAGTLGHGQAGTAPLHPESGSYLVLAPGTSVDDNDRPELAWNCRQSFYNYVERYHCK